MNRGEIWWAELSDDAGFRPVAIVSRSDQIDGRTNVTIAEITRVVRSLPSEIPLTTDDGMPTNCVVNTDNLHTIPKSRLRQTITKLTDEQVYALTNALKYSLELNW